MKKFLFIAIIIVLIIIAGSFLFRASNEEPLSEIEGSTLTPGDDIVDMEQDISVLESDLEILESETEMELKELEGSTEKINN